VIAALTGHQPWHPFPGSNTPPSPRHPPLRTAGSDCPRAEGRLPPRPRPSRLLRRSPLPPAPGPPGPADTWSGARREPLQRPAPAPSSDLESGSPGARGWRRRRRRRRHPPPPAPCSSASLLFLRLRAPLTGRSSWPGGASPGRLEQHRAFTRAERGMGIRAVPGQGPRSGAPQPRAPENSSRRRWSFTERPPRVPESGAAAAAAAATSAPSERRALRSRLHPQSRPPPAPPAPSPPPGPRAPPPTPPRRPSRDRRGHPRQGCGADPNPWAGREGGQPRPPHNG
jgi:hypothetical protein